MVKIPGLIVLLIATVYDYREYRIPNALILVGYGVTILSIVLCSGVSGVLPAIVRALIPIGLFYLLFFIRAIGAGDLKLLSLAALACSTEELFDLVVFSFVIGAAISAVRLLTNGQFIVRISSFIQYIQQCIWEGRVKPYHTFEDTASFLHFSLCILLAYCAIFCREVFVSRF